MMTEGGTRSIIRRMGSRQSVRARRYLVRAGGVLAVAALVVVFVQSIRMRVFDPDGPGRVLYFAHDTIYLWAKGHAWVKYFPYVLVWLVPLAIASALALWEALRPNGPLRRAHAAMIRFCASRHNLQWLLGGSLAPRPLDAGVWRRYLDPADGGTRRRSGFARRVIAQSQEGLWRRVAVSAGDGSEAGVSSTRHLFQLLRMRLKLDLSDPTAHLRALEVCMLLPDAAESRKLSLDLAAIYAHPANVNLSEPLLHIVEIMDAVSDMNASQAAVLAAQSVALLKTEPDRQTGIAALQAACLVLKSAALAAVHPTPQASAFHRTWISRSLENEAFRRVAVLAEKMIFFEFWAHRTEPRLSIYPKGDLIRSGLDPEISTLIDAPEAHAWNGAGGGRP